MATKDLDEKSAILQRDGETFAITPRIPCGVITDIGLLRRLADVAEKYQVKAVKITSSERIALVGIKEQDLDRVYAELGAAPGFAGGLCVRSVNACPGVTFCRLGLQDSLSLGLRLEREFGNLELPAKLKMAVSGCPMGCGNSHVRDIGLIGSKKGFMVKIGGSAGAQPHLGQVLEKAVTPDVAVERVRAIIGLIKELGRKKRLYSIVDELGLDGVRQRLGLPLEGRPEAGSGTSDG
jgi:NAD(P)H-nitrite reductase large subunit